MFAEIHAFLSQILQESIFCKMKQKVPVKHRPGNNSGLSGILGFGSEIFCENAVVATQETLIAHCEFLENLTEKKLGENVVYFNK